MKKKGKKEEKTQKISVLWVFLLPISLVSKTTKGL